MSRWTELEKQHSELKTIRAREESLWRDLSRLLEEDGGDLDVRSADSDRRAADTFDSTPLYAKDDFVGGIFTEAVNPAERWFSLTIPDKDLAKWGPVKQHLSDRAGVLFGSLDPARSSFYIEAQPWLADMATFGTGFLWQEEWVGRNRLIERAMPIRETFKCVDAAGVTERIHREYMLTGWQAKGRWGERAPNMRDNESAVFVHAIYQNPDYREGMLGLRGMRWLSCHASPDKTDFQIEGGYHELPMHEVQWKRRSSRAWGVGPGHKALADMRMLDEMGRFTQTALQFEAEPMMLVHDEDIMTAADIQPNALIYGGMTEQGKKLVERVERGEQLQLPMAEREQVRQAVRNGFHFSLFQIVSRPQMTLGEFMGWKEEKLRLLAPHLVTIQPGLASFIARRDAIMVRAGAYNHLPLPQELEGQAITIEFVSPFAQVQKSAKARSALQLGQAALQLQPLNPEVGDNLDTDNIMVAIADGMSGDPAFVRDPRDVAAIRKMRAQAQQPDIELARDAQQAEIVATVAHAKQASTRSDERQGRRS